MYNKLKEYETIKRQEKNKKKEDEKEKSSRTDDFNKIRTNSLKGSKLFYEDGVNIVKQDTDIVPILVHSTDRESQTTRDRLQDRADQHHARLEAQKEEMARRKQKEEKNNIKIEENEEKNKIKQSELIQQGIVVPFLPKEIDYSGCKALKLYPAKQGKREGLFLPCCAPPKENGLCVACLKSDNNYGCLDDRMKQQGLYKSSNNKTEIIYKDWFKDNKKYTYEDMKNKIKHIGVKLSIFEEKIRHRSPSISSDEGEDSISEIIKDGIVYHITNKNTIFNDDCELVGRIDEDGEPIWSI
jgi:hypothetical protein